MRKEAIITVEGIQFKHCNKCGLNKLLHEFSRKTIQNCCKKCISAYSKEMYQKNKTKYYKYVRKTVKITDLERKEGDKKVVRLICDNPELKKYDFVINTI
jgi:hypothetical protein